LPTSSERATRRAGSAAHEQGNVLCLQARAIARIATGAPVSTDSLQQQPEITSWGRARLLCARAMDADMAL